MKITRSYLSKVSFRYKETSHAVNGHAVLHRARGKSIKISIVENLLHTKRVIALEVKIIRYFTKMFNVDAPLKETIVRNSYANGG